MTDVVDATWFWPAVLVTFGLPIALIVLTELLASLERRGSPAVKAVKITRNWILPLGALLLLMSQVEGIDTKDVSGARVVATVFGFVVILALLSVLNAALFDSARRGTWRQRIPSIFVDIARLAIIVLSLALLFSWVWGADVGGLFTAIGVSTIVIGLALQNAAGSVVSGLLLLFEQPFQLGDWLDTGSVRGQVVEVNWRAVHIDTGNGIQIVPTASLAGSAFRNLSRTRGAYRAETTLQFATDDPPHEVIAAVLDVAAALPNLTRGVRTTVRPLGGAKYLVSLPIDGPVSEDDTLGALIAWLWYAARRHDLHLDNDLTDDFRTPERLDAALRNLADVLQMTPDEASQLAPSTRLERFGRGERLQEVGRVHTAMRFLVDGRALLTAPLGEGHLAVTEIGPGESIGLGAYTRQPADLTCTALTDVTVVRMPVGVVDQVITARPELAVTLGRAVDTRHELTQAALSTHLAAGGGRT